MPHSLICVYLHIIFHVKNTSPVIRQRDLNTLHAYLAATTYNLCQGLQPEVGGTQNHVHLLCSLPKDNPVPIVVNKLKVASHQWLDNQGNYYHPFAWQKGYGVFSVSPNNLSAVRHYIQHQEQHHQRLSARDEYLQLLHRCGIEPQAVPFLLYD
jgi:putative transposase